MTTPVRAALYLRVSTGRQAEHDLSIPDQRRQAEGFCTGEGVEDRRLRKLSPAPPRPMIGPPRVPADDGRGLAPGPPPFKVIVVHSFSRFFRGPRFSLNSTFGGSPKTACVCVSITQDLGDDPMSVMMRQIMALFDEYQSKENAKHTLRAMKENARQGFWNGGAGPPFGYQVVTGAERRVARGPNGRTRHRPDPGRDREAHVPTGAVRRRGAGCAGHRGQSSPTT